MTTKLQTHEREMKAEMLLSEEKKVYLLIEQVLL